MAGGLELRVDARQIAAIGKRFQDAKAKMPGALAAAVQHIGPYALGAMKAELPGQTGLKSKTVDKALKGASRGATYVIKSHGGDIRLKYFGARETAGGVSAAPWNDRKVYAATFIKSGWWPNRREPIAKGQVLRRKGESKYPMEVVKSGLYIAEEMVKDGCAAAFYNTVGALMPGALESVLFGALSGGGAKAQADARSAAAREVNTRLSHVGLNDPIPF
jgi:hypothetical protein